MERGLIDGMIAVSSSTATATVTIPRVNIAGQLKVEGLTADVQKHNIEMITVLFLLVGHKGLCLPKYWLERHASGASFRDPV